MREKPLMARMEGDVDIASWLRGIGLEQYHSAFQENDIDAGVLLTLTDRDLRELGVASLGHRKRMLAAIAVLDRATDTPNDSNGGVRVTDETASGRRQRLCSRFMPSAASSPSCSSTWSARPPFQRGSIPRICETSSRLTNTL